MDKRGERLPDTIGYVSGPHFDGRTSQFTEQEERFMRGPNGTPLMSDTDELDSQAAQQPSLDTTTQDI